MIAADVVRTSGVSTQTLSNLVTGRNKKSTDIARLARALGVDAYWLETGRGIPKLTDTPIEAALRDTFAQMTPEDQAWLLQMAQRLVDRSESAAHRASPGSDDEPRDDKESGAA